MVITLYADRRSPEVAEVADRLARALAVRDPAFPVALVAPVGGAKPTEARGEAGRGRPEWLLEELPPEIGEFLAMLAARHAVGVVAVSGPPNERILATLDASHRVLLMSDPSVPSLRATQRALKLCMSLGYGAEKVSVLLHGFAHDATLVPAEAAAVLKREIFGVVPGPTASEIVRDAFYGDLAERLAATD